MTMVAFSCCWYLCRFEAVSLAGCAGIELPLPPRLVNGGMCEDANPSDGGGLSRPACASKGGAVGGGRTGCQVKTRVPS